MKRLLLASLLLVACTKETPNTTPAPVSDAAPSANPGSPLERIEVHTAMVNGELHWMPETIHVKAGKDYLLVAKHDMPEGYSYHGIEIKGLGVQSQVNRGKEFTQVISLPDDKKGTYSITCYFHPQHREAKLIVE